MNRYITIDQLARDILSSSGDLGHLGLTRMLFVLKPIIDRFSDIISPEIVSNIFVMDANHTVTLPEHAIYPVKIGKIINGQIHSFGVDPSVRSLANVALSNYAVVTENGECSCSPISSKPPETIYAETESAVDDGLIFHNCMFNNQYHFELYGLKERQFKLGKYNYNQKARRFEFGSGTGVGEGEEVIVEYVTDSGSGRYRMIPREAYSFFRHMALQQYAEVDGNAVMAKHHRREARIAEDEYGQIHNPITAKDIVAAFVSGYASIK